jgi:hypothetical protein
VDLPGHGETIGLNEEQYSIDKFVDKLKLVIHSFLLELPFDIFCSFLMEKV